MGTTTLSLQLVKFLQSTGYTAAYVECNRQQYIWAVASTYGGVVLQPFAIASMVGLSD